MQWAGTTRHRWPTQACSERPATAHSYATARGRRERHGFCDSAQQRQQVIAVPQQKWRPERISNYPRLRWFCISYETAGQSDFSLEIRQSSRTATGGGRSA